MSDALDLPPELTIPISPPLEYNGGKYEELRLREPTVGEVRKAEGQLKNGIHAESVRLHNVHLAASVSGWPVPVVEKLPISKLNQATAYLAGFISGSPATGES